MNAYGKDLPEEARTALAAFATPRFQCEGRKLGLQAALAIGVDIRSGYAEYKATNGKKWFEVAGGRGVGIAWIDLAATSSRLKEDPAPMTYGLGRVTGSKIHSEALVLLSKTHEARIGQDFDWDSPGAGIGGLGGSDYANLNINARITPYITDRGALLRSLFPAKAVAYKPDLKRSTGSLRAARTTYCNAVAEDRVKRSAGAESPSSAVPADSNLSAGAH